MTPTLTLPPAVAALHIALRVADDDLDVPQHAAAADLGLPAAYPPTGRHAQPGVGPAGRRNRPEPDA